jgi:DNA mismatch repair protein MutS
LEPPQTPGGCESGMLTTAPSILFPQAEDRAETGEAPEFFADLHLDEIVDAIVGGKEEYDLKPFFWLPLRRPEAIAYRHEVFRDVEDANVVDCVRTFARGMQEVRGNLEQAKKLYAHYQRQAWFLMAVHAYCEAIERCSRELSAANPQSRGLTAFSEYLAGYARSAGFTELRDGAEDVAAGVRGLRYAILIRDNGFTVRSYADEPDYSAAVEETFAKFQQGTAKSYRIQFKDPVEMNHIEEKVLEFVSRLYPAEFGRVDAFCDAHRDFIDAAVATFDREIQFYVAYLDYAEKFRAAGLHMCYPQIATDGDKAISSTDGFDLALARKLVAEGGAVVCNDFHLTAKERIIVVSGPNQGGKTTFARAFGQIHYLAALGGPVPGRDAHLFHFDALYVQFEKEESIENLRSKLEVDLVRLRAILDRATSESIIILNEVFTSTTIADAIFLSKQIMRRLIDKDLIAVWVTFIDELASYSEQTISMTSMVIPENPAMRTFKIVRRPADGLAYALAIAESRHVTYAALVERIKP